MAAKKPDFTTEEAAEVYYLKLPKDMIEYYENIYLMRQDNKDAMIDLLEEWLIDKRMRQGIVTIENDLHLKNLICYVIDINNATNTDETESYKNAKKQSENRKYYLYRKVREEMGDIKSSGGNPKFIANSYKYYIANLRSSDSSTTKAYTKQEYIAREYQRAEEWFNNPESFIFQFPYFETLAPKRRANCLITDITYYVYRLIRENYYSSSYGYVTRTPDVDFGIPDAQFINWAKTSLDLKFEANDNMVSVFEEYEFEKAGPIRMIIDEIPADCSTPEKQKEAIERIEREYSSGKRVRALDTIDFSIYTSVLNSINLNVYANAESIRLPFKNYAKLIYNNKNGSGLRAKDYSDIFSRLVKLARLKISTTTQDADGKTVTGSVISFFDLSYSLNTDSDISQRTINVSGSGRLPDEQYSAKDFDGMEVEITPSKFMKDQWKTIHSYVVSESYQQITSTKGKMILQILQEKRMQIYPEREVVLPISFFKDKFYFAKRDSRFKQEVAAELEELRINSVLVESYRIHNNEAHIKFLPLTETENSIFFKKGLEIKEA